MKLTTIIILVACLHTSANGLAQQTVTFSGKEVRLENVFNAIKKQTSYRFFFNTNMLQQASKVSIDVRNAPIEQVMTLALKDQQLTYTIKGRTIFIMMKVGEQKSSLNIQAPTGDPITVSGRILDENGAPAQGVNVVVKGTSKGATTNLKGEFEIKDVSENAVLLITSVGYDRQEILVKNKNFVTAQLKVAVGNLDEMQVVAYGTTSKRFNTGNVSTVKSTDIEKQPVTNPLLALQGRVPGIEIRQSTGVPGSGVTVRIRGRNSINNGNDPLYIIDGVPFQSQNLPGIGSILGRSGSNNGSITGNPLNFINPEDIESIEVLKDADATAIYGSRAANGAILITTKKGKPGVTKVTFDTYYGWGSITQKIKLLNTREYLDMRYEGLRNSNVSNIPATSYDLNHWDTSRYTDWQEELIGGTAKYNNMRLSLSGGNNNTKYLISGSYHKETTVFPGDFSDKRGTVHFNVSNTTSNQRLTVQLSGNYLFDNNRLSGSDVTNYITLAPNAPAIYNEDGSLNWALNSSGVSTWQNPLARIKKIYKNQTYNLVSNSIIGYKILPSLEVKSSFGYSNTRNNEISTNPFSSLPPDAIPNSERSASFTNNTIQTWIIEPQMNYQVNVLKGKLGVLIGGTLQQNISNGEIKSASGFNNDLILEDIKSAPKVTINSTTIANYRYSALFARLNYNWNNTVLFNLNARRDGSSRFGPDKRFHNFGAIGAGWIFSNEKFIQSNISFLSFGKIRGSYGTTGSDQIGDYRFHNLYSSISSSYPYQGAVGLFVNSLYNPDLAWEETKKWEGGFELGFLNDRIFIQGSYFRNKSSNQLIGYQLPSNTGFNSVTANRNATVQNSGWEFVLNSTIINRQELRWNVSINFTFTKNKLLSLGREVTDLNSIRRLGQSLSNIYVFKFAGVDPTTGIYQFFDSTGSLVSQPVFGRDDYIKLNRDVQYYGGFQNSFSYKGFGLDLLFQFVKQIGVTNAFGIKLPGNFLFGNGNQPETILNRWQKLGDDAQIQKVVHAFSPDVSDAYDYATNSDRNYSDASFIRLKNVSVTYQLPKKIFGKIQFTSGKLYFQCQNLFTLTGYEGLDPETQSYTSLPPLKVLTVGLQVCF